MLAALLGALRIVGKRAEDITVVVVGAGAAGVACTEIMLAQGVGDVIVCDRDGALVRGRPRPDASHAGSPRAPTSTTAAGWPTSCSRARTCCSASPARAP